MFTDRKWRDYLVLFAAWLILLWGSGTAWLTHFGFGNYSMFGLSWFSEALNIIHLVILAFVICLPALFIFGQIRFFDSQHPMVYHLSLFALSLTFAFVTFTGRHRFRTFAGVIAAFAVSLIVLIMFYKQNTVKIPRLLESFLYIAVNVIAHQTYRLLVDWPHIYINSYGPEIDLSSQYAAYFRVIFLAIILVVTFYPLIKIPCVKRISRDSTIEIPAWLYLAFLFLMLGLQFYVWQTRQKPQLYLVLNISVIAGCFFSYLLYRELTSYIKAEYLQSTDKHSDYRILILISLAYFILAIPLAIKWVGPKSFDTFTYFQIARSYADGQLAVRGLWSPLISWLLIPSMVFNFNPEVAERVMVVVSGYIWMVAAYGLASNLNMSHKSRLAVTAAMGILVIKYTFWPLTPDFLSGMLLTVYFYLLLNKKTLEKPVLFGLVIGLIGGLAYFARYFNFPFFVAHLLMTVILLALHQGDRVQALKLMAASLVSFALVIAPWIILLSMRYGGFTTSTSSAYASARFGAERKMHCADVGLCIEPDDILFPMEDPDPNVINQYSWSPFASFDNVHTYYLNFKGSLVIWFDTMFANLGLLVVIGILSSALMALLYWADIKRRFVFLWIFLTMAIYSGGYLLSTFSGEFRYHYPLFPLFVISTYLLVEPVIDALSARFGTLNYRQYALMFLLAVPIMAILFRHTGYTPRVSLLEPTNWDNCQQEDAQGLEQYLISPMVGTDLSIQVISYYTQTRTYGSVDTGLPSEIVDEQLQGAGVKTFLLPSGSALSEELISNFEYTKAADVTYCTSQYTILYTPEP